MKSGNENRFDSRIGIGLESDIAGYEKIKKIQQKFASHIGSEARSADHHVQRFANVHLVRKGRPNPVLVSRNVNLIDFLGGGEVSRGDVGFLSDTPSVALVIGDYGTGKTELLWQVHSRIDNDPKGFVCLPFSLALARRGLKALTALRKKRKKEDRAKGFVRFLLDSIPEANAIPEEVMIQKIRDGKTILLLDAVDELTRHRSYYLGLLKGIVDLAVKGRRDAPVRIVFSIRREVLSTLDSPRAEDTIDLLIKRANVFLIEIQQFGELEIKEYFVKKLGGVAYSQYERLKKSSPHVLNALHRPLVLKVFAELIGDRPSFIPSDVDGKFVSAYLIHEYIKLAHERGLAEQKYFGAKHAWNLLKLACESVAAFREGRVGFEDVHISRFVDPPIGQKALKQLGVKGKPDEEVFACIHKCPFLIREVSSETGGSEKDITSWYSHESFNEHFTAYGIVQETAEQFKKHEYVKEEAIKQSDSFNHLVVESNTRLTMQYLFEAEHDLNFYDLIYYSCGLQDETLWSKRIWERREEDFDLSATLKTLTEAMSEPRKYSPDVFKTIQEFLERCEPREFAPGYMMYCFHAVTTYLNEQDNTVESVRLLDELERKLQQVLAVATGFINDEKARVEEWERLFELVIRSERRLPRRLRWYPNARKLKQVKKTVEKISNVETKARCKHWIEMIEYDAY